MWSDAAAVVSLLLKLMGRRGRRGALATQCLHSNCIHVNKQVGKEAGSNIAGLQLPLLEALLLLYQGRPSWEGSVTNADMQEAGVQFVNCSTLAKRGRGAP
jgi:hypothetical protein